MRKINRSRLHKILFIIVLIFSLFGPQSQAAAKTIRAIANDQNWITNPGRYISPVTGERSDTSFKELLSENREIASPTHIMTSLVPGGLYGTDGQNLYIIDKTTGTATLIGPHGPVEDYIGALAFDKNGILYGTSVTSYAQLYRIDPTTGGAVAVGPLGIGFIFEGGLGFDSTGQLFGVNQVGDSIDSNPTMFRIDTATGAATIIGPMPGEDRDIDGIAVDGSTFYAIERLSNSLGVLNTATGAYTIIGNTGVTIGDTGGLAVDPVDGTLYATFESGDFYRLDKTTGIATLIAVNHVNFGLDFAPLSADLSITKSDSPDPVTTGGSLTYTLTVTNNGSSDAVGVTTSDSLPVGVTLVSANSSVGTCTGLSCDLGNLANGASATITITVTVDPATPCGATLTNMATVQSTVSDPNLANNTASADTTVTCQADLSITKSDAPDPVVPGGDLTYTLTLTNNGSGAATEVSVSDTLPPGVTLVTVSATSSAGTCTAAAGVVNCYVGAMATGTSINVIITATVDATTPCGATLTNVATVQSTVSDPNLANNTAGADTTVTCPADLSITKSDAPDPVMAGGALIYTLAVTNNGPGAATGVTVTDTLPAGVTFDAATSTPGCTEAASVVTCAIGNLANGASTTLTINVTVDPATPPGTITNTAAVSASETDPDTTNNSASTDTTITAVSDVCPILDDFNRANGPLGSDWNGHTAGYRIKDNQVIVHRGRSIYWQPEAYGSDQEACVTLTRINPKSRQHALLLKVQEQNNWGKGAILVSYNARSGNIEVKARNVTTHRWTLVGIFMPATPVMNGDQLRAKAFADGIVEVFINNTSLGTADAGSFYADKGGQIGLWFSGRQTDDDEDNDHSARNDDEGDDNTPSGHPALFDDFGGGTIITTPPLMLTQISSDPFTDTTSQHKTQVEPDTFSNGSTIVAAMQTGRFFSGGASNICWSTLSNSSLVANGCLPGITTFASPAGTFDRISDPAVAFDAKHGVWLISTLAVRDTGVGLIGDSVLSSRSTDATATAWNNPVVVSAISGSSFYDKNWIACDNTPASPFYGNCYTEWDDHGQGNLLQMSTSSDGGLTWGPKKTNTFHGLGGQPIVQPNGTVIVPYLNGSQILAFLSTDGGSTWGNSFVVSNVSFHIPGGDLRSEPLPSAEIDGAGRVYVVWADCRFRTSCTSNDIVMSTSTDGMSWSSVIRVPIGSATDGADLFVPAIAVDNTTSGATARVGITYYYYPVASCTFTTCQLNVGFISSPDGGANWTGVTTLAGPMTMSWLPDTSQGRMVGDYISTSYGSDGLAHSVFIVAKEPTGNPDCAIATPNCDQAAYTTSSGLALATMSNTLEALSAAEVGIPQPPIPLHADENVPDQTNLTRY